jgi:hypothetical protein
LFEKFLRTDIITISTSKAALIGAKNNMSYITRVTLL